ncbi:MAG: DUF1415 domain-containing protein [Bacteroidia bacterium]|nr:DUF1415 domain-containing protein [Bacteroidia bacterium]MCF8425386.1 DUF1415 domain-containing protein [Bacteroidia bacterium]
MPSKEEMILQTQKWVLEVVVGTNFCPFAAKEVKNKTIRYTVANEGTKKEKLDAVLSECILLDEHADIETTLLLFPNEFPNFLDFLDFVVAVERMMYKKGYEGIYQVASFHPEYCFEGSDETDAANYTNRSIYPMLHLLREESLERALETFPNPENIPNRNINFARNKGLAYMKLLREQCM